MEEHKPSEKKEVKTVYVSKNKKNPWMAYTAVLAVICVILAFFLYTNGGLTGNSIGKDAAGEKLVEYLNSRTGGGVAMVSAEDSGSLYKVMVSYQGDEIPVYITKDGEFFVQGVVPITLTADNNTITDTTTNTQPPEVPKSDKPTVELFVMTECPYGTQAEKGIIPVLELLGDKIDAQIKFVHYFMHGDKEEQETYRQVCIREEQSDKYMDYLKCYLADGDADRCIKEVGISESKLKSCISKNSEKYYEADSTASEEAGVQGSPTLVINGEIISSSRSPQAFLSTICAAFNNPPAECSETLDSTNPSPGFGYSASGSATSASCS